MALHTLQNLLGLALLRSTLRDIWSIFVREISTAVFNLRVDRRARDAVDVLRRELGHCSFVSLGHACHTSSLLKRWGIKKYSLPFDWVFSNNAIIIHCLGDNFETFLDTRQFVSLPSKRKVGFDRKKCRHLLYDKQLGLATLFNHRDPTQPADLEYYRRCVGRFARLCDSNQPIIFVSIFRTLAKEHDSFLQVERALKLRGLNFFLLGISITEEHSGRPYSTDLHTSDQSALINMHSMSHWASVRFNSIEDEVYLHELICRLLLARCSGLMDGRDVRPAIDFREVQAPNEASAMPRRINPAGAPR